MTSAFKALDALVVKDDFYPDPDAIRQIALTRAYEKPPANTPRLAVTSMCNEQESREMFERLSPYLENKQGNSVVAANIMFRYTLKNAQKKVFCHVDGCSGAGIVYLSLPQNCAGGTTIYRHRETGDEIYNRANRHLYNFNDESQWEILREVEMVYNRLVFYPGQLFHAITPIFFGDSIENARLTQNVFIFRQNDRQLM